jgi:hypothetical protein
MRKDYLTTFLAAGFFLAGAFFATFFAGAFLTVAFLVAFFAGAFLAGISYPPFHSAVAEDKIQITIGLTNEHSRQRQSEIVTTLNFQRCRKSLFTSFVVTKSPLLGCKIASLDFLTIIFCGTAFDRNYRPSDLAARIC